MRFRLPEPMLFHTAISLCMVSTLLITSGCCAVKIAIIGAGIGGTSCAWKLRKLLPDDVTIDVFEATSKIGGRLAVAQFGDKTYEIGGSIIHARNEYMNRFRDLFGFQKREDEHDKTEGIYDGYKFRFKSSRCSVLTILKLLWRYGYDVIRLHRTVNELLSSFERIYRLQDDEYAFSTVNTLLAALSSSFVNMTRKPLDEFLKERGFGDRFIYELAEAAGLVNYGQSVDELKAFVGTVSLAGAGSDLWSVKGGNYRVAEALLNSSGAVLHRCNVDSILQRSDKNYSLQCASSKDFSGDGASAHNSFNDSIDRRAFDGYAYVVVAHPLTSDSLRLPFASSSPANFEEPFHVTVATLLEGDLSPESFGLPADENELGAILSCNRKTFYQSVGLQAETGASKASTDRKVLDGVPSSTRKVWKTFSRESLSSAALQFLFHSLNRKKEVKWLAYPEYKHFNRSDIAFEIAPNIYHINAIEWAASAMEMSVIGGVNVALLIKHSISAQSSKIDSTFLSNMLPLKEL